MLHTTFRLARERKACAPRYGHLRAALSPEEYGDDTPIPLTLVLKHSGIADAIWCLRATLEPSDRLARLFACDCAEHVLPLFEARHPTDARPRQAIETARRFALGEVTAEELAAAEDAAWDAVRDARAAARAARAAWDAASAAARDAAWDAAEDAAWAAVVAAERAWQAQRLREMLEEAK